MPESKNSMVQPLSRSIPILLSTPQGLPPLFNPPMVPPARGDSGGTKVVPPNPPRDGLSSTEMESCALAFVGILYLISCRGLLLQAEEPGWPPRAYRPL